MDTTEESVVHQGIRMPCQSLDLSSGFLNLLASWGFLNFVENNISEEEFKLEHDLNFISDLMGFLFHEGNSKRIYPLIEMLSSSVNSSPLSTC